MKKYIWLIAFILISCQPETPDTPPEEPPEEPCIWGSLSCNIIGDPTNEFSLKMINELNLSVDSIGLVCLEGNYPDRIDQAVWGGERFFGRNNDGVRGTQWSRQINLAPGDSVPNNYIELDGTGEVLIYVVINTLYIERTLSDTVVFWAEQDTAPPDTVGLASAVVSWDPNTESDLAGYRVYYGLTSGKYTVFFDVGDVTHFQIDGFRKNITYYFAVTAYDENGNESPYSVEVAWQWGATNVELKGWL